MALDKVFGFFKEEVSKLAQDPTATISKFKSKQALTAGSGLFFPSDIDTEGKFIRFKIKKYSRPGAEKKEVRSTEAVIRLPMPAQLVNADSHTYEDFDSGYIGQLYNQVGSGVSEIASGAMNLDLSAIVSGGLNTAAAVGRGGVEGTLRAGAKVTGNFGRLVQQTAGTTFNPRKSTIYSSPNLKQYSYAFKLIARDKSESDSIKEIVDTFRFFSYPDAANPEYGTYSMPELFEITFEPDTYLFKTNDCVLTGMSVSYNGDNSPTFFEGTGAPVEVDLQLQFQEVETDTKTTLVNKG